jgi:hypothetical protein
MKLITSEYKLGCDWVWFITRTEKSDIINTVVDFFWCEWWECDLFDWVFECKKEGEVEFWGYNFDGYYFMCVGLKDELRRG